MTAANFDRDQISSAPAEVSTTSRRVDAERRIAGPADPFSYLVTDRLGSPGLDRFLAARQFSQSGHVADDHHVMLNKGDVFAGQPAQHAVDMHAGEAEVITDLLLRQVHIKRRARDQSTAPNRSYRSTSIAATRSGASRRAIRSVNSSERRRPSTRSEVKQRPISRFSIS